MTEFENLTLAELEAGLDEVKKSPKDEGVLYLIVARPKVGEREVLEKGELDTQIGLVGDNWQTKKSWATADKKPHPEMQINIMNSRAISLIAQTKDRWRLAGDQFYVDLDLSEENLPPGSRLKFGTAILEITEVPHNGCIKFTKRFGKDSVKFVNSKIGKQLHLRGLNAKVVKGGTVKTGDVVKKI